MAPFVARAIRTLDSGFAACDHGFRRRPGCELQNARTVSRPDPDRLSRNGVFGNLLLAHQPTLWFVLFL